MGSRWARVARGLLASGVAIFVAALFHVAGGGAAPGALPLALSLAFSTIASIALTGRSLSLWRLTVAVGASQFLFHLLFGLGTGTATFTAPAGTTHLHAGSHLTMSMSGSMPTAMPAAHDEFSLGMWGAHLTAVLVTVIALRFGEQAFWGLFDTARMHVARFADRRILSSLAVLPTTLAHSAAASAASAFSREPVRLLDLGVPLLRLRHRGPPLAAAF